MKSKKITITSKNRVTLPAEYVMNMQVSQNRVLNAELRGGSIVLTPQPALATVMQHFWGKHQAKRPLSNEELKNAVRTSATDRLTKDV